MKKNARKSNKNVKATKGSPGAPKKLVKYPRSNFTVKDAIKFNNGVACGLTVRNRITEDVELGVLVENGLRPQPNAKVGRPSTLYILAALAKNRKVKATSPAAPTPIKATRKPKADKVTLAPVVDVAPPVEPVTNVASPTVEAPAEKEIPPVVPASLP